MNSTIVKKNVITIYAPGSGGHHVSNLISTDVNLTTNFKIEDYKKTNNKDARFFNDDLLNDDYKKFKKAIKNNRSYESHVFDLPGNKWVKVIKEKFFVVITLPSLGSKGHQRMIKVDRAWQSSALYYDMQVLYTVKSIKKLFNVTSPVIEIDGDRLFEDKNFIKYLSKKLEKINLNLDYDLCEEAHRLWLSYI